MDNIYEKLFENEANLFKSEKELIQKIREEANSQYISYFSEDDLQYERQRQLRKRKWSEDVALLKWSEALVDHLLSQENVNLYVRESERLPSDDSTVVLPAQLKVPLRRLDQACSLTQLQLTLDCGNCLTDVLKDIPCALFDDHSLPYLRELSISVRCAAEQCLAVPAAAWEQLGKSLSTHQSIRIFRLAAERMSFSQTEALFVNFFSEQKQLAVLCFEVWGVDIVMDLMSICGFMHLVGRHVGCLSTNVFSLALQYGETEGLSEIVQQRERGLPALHLLWPSLSRFEWIDPLSANETLRELQFICSRHDCLNNLIHCRHLHTLNVSLHVDSEAAIYPAPDLSPFFSALVDKLSNLRSLTLLGLFRWPASTRQLLLALCERVEVEEGIALRLLNLGSNSCTDCADLLCKLMASLHSLSLRSTELRVTDILLLLQQLTNSSISIKRIFFGYCHEPYAWQHIDKSQVCEALLNCVRQNRRLIEFEPPRLCMTTTGFNQLGFEVLGVAIAQHPTLHCLHLDFLDSWHSNGLREFVKGAVGRPESSLRRLVLTRGLISNALLSELHSAMKKSHPSKLEYIEGLDPYRDPWVSRRLKERRKLVAQIQASVFAFGMAHRRARSQQIEESELITVPDWIATDIMQLVWNSIF